MFGGGKLKDGQICHSCFVKINKIDGKFALNLKNHSYEDLKIRLNEEQDNRSTNLNRLVIYKQQIQNLGLERGSQYLGRKEINELPQILDEKEEIDGIIQGTYNKGQGILVSTNRRLVFIDKGLLYGLKVEDFPLSRITSIQYETGIIFGKLKIYASSNVAEIDNAENSRVRQFAEFIRNKLSDKEQMSSNTLGTDMLAQLEMLGKLKEAGVLSEEEFKEQKLRIIKGL